MTNYRPPDWKGRTRIEHPIRWQKASDIVEVGVSFIQEMTEYGHFDLWSIYFNNLKTGQIVAAPLQAIDTITATGTSNYTSKASWNNSSNTVEVIGGGGAGAHGATTTTGGGGGAGGGYNRVSNYSFATPGTTTAPCGVGVAGLHGGTFPQNGGDTWFGTTTFPASGTAVGARGGSSPATNTTATGGTAAATSTFFPTTSPPARSGGSAGNGASATAGGGGGGGGGPNGAGGAGSGTTGGTGDGGTVTAGAAGNPGTSFKGREWGSNGVGGGGGGSNASGGTGGTAIGWGGGAGGGSRSTGTGGDGSQGAIILTWNIPGQLADWPGVRQILSAYQRGFAATPLTLTGTNNPFSQDSWPLPIPIPWNPQSFSIRNFALLSGPVVTYKPGTVTDWGVPIAPIISLQPHPIQFKPSAPTAPFGLDDWPLPQRPIFTQNFPTQFMPPTAAVVNYMPGRVTDWGNPPLGPSPTGQFWTQRPQITVTTAPFSQVSWPNPAITRTTGQFWTARAQIGSNPFRQSDWPLPRPLPPLGQFWTKAPQITPNPFSQDDWPAALRVSYRDYTFTSQGRAIATVGAPFRQSDWPVPIRAAYRDYTWINQGITSAQVVVSYRPGTVTDWGQVQAALQPGGFLGKNFALTTTPAVKPFKQDSWPIPQQPQRAISLSGFINQSTNFLIRYAVRGPTYAYRYPVYHVDWIAQSNIGLLITPPTKPQNRQSDWPVPIRLPLHFDWLPQSNLALLTAPVITFKPGMVMDWGAPILIPPTGQTWTRGPQITPTVNPPNRQSSWPLPPRLPPPVGQYWANTPGPARIPTNRPPIRQHIWPVPQRPGQPQSVYFWSQSPRVIPSVTPVTPFDPFVWSEADWRKYQKRLKRRQQQLDKEEKQRAKLRTQLLNLYRGIDDSEFTRLPLDDILPVRLQIHEDHLDQIALQLAQMQDRLKLHQRELVRRYLADMEQRRDEEEMEMLVSAIL